MIGRPLFANLSLVLTRLGHLVLNSDWSPIICELVIGPHEAGSSVLVRWELIRTLTSLPFFSVLASIFLPWHCTSLGVVRLVSARVISLKQHMMEISRQVHVKYTNLPPCVARKDTRAALF